MKLLLVNVINGSQKSIVLNGLGVFNLLLSFQGILTLKTLDCQLQFTIRCFPVEIGHELFW